MRQRYIGILGLLLVAPISHAQEGIYIGLGLGSFDYEEEITDILYGRVADSTTVTKLFAGFEFNEHISMEMSYGKSSSLVIDGSADIPPFGDINGVLRTDFNITTMRGIGQLPFDWGVLMAGLGYFTSENDFSEVITSACCGTATNSGSIRDEGLTAMLGAEWRFGRFGTRWGVRLEYEWWDITDLETSSLGLGISYGF